MLVAALIAAFVLLTHGSGNGDAAGSSGDRSGDVIRITTSLKGDNGWVVIATDWYQPSTGRWSSDQPVEHTKRVYDVTEYREQQPGLLRIVRGSVPYVAAIGHPSFANAPGVYLDRLSQAHLTLDEQRVAGRVKVTRDGLKTVISSAYGYATDSGSGAIPLRSEVDPPISAADAEARGAFALPTGTITGLEVQSAPASPSRLGIPAFWLGETANGKTARATIESQDSKAQIAANRDGFWAQKRYDLIYRDAALPTTVKGDALYGPSFVGVPSHGPISTDVTVESTTIGEDDPFIREQPAGSVQTITLADGEQATLTSWFEYGSSLAMVTTDKARIVIKGLPELTTQHPSQPQYCDLVDLASSLRPVGYTGTITQSQATGPSCRPKSTLPPPPAEFPQPGNPPEDNKDFNLPGGRRPTELVRCTKTSQGQIVANLEKALACTKPFRAMPASCVKLTNPRAEPSFVTFAAATLVPQPGCDKLRGQALFYLGKPGWVPIYYAANPICGGWTQVPYYILQRMFPNYLEEHGPDKSKSYACPGS